MKRKLGDGEGRGEIAKMDRYAFLHPVLPLTSLSCPSVFHTNLFHFPPNLAFLLRIMIRCLLIVGKKGLWHVLYSIALKVM